jgi:hypothetical protein
MFNPFYQPNHRPLILQPPSLPAVLQAAEKVKPSNFPALASSARWANSFKIMKHYVQGHILCKSWFLSHPIHYLLALFNFFIAIVSLMPQTSSLDLYSAEICRFQPKIWRSLHSPTFPSGLQSDSDQTLRLHSDSNRTSPPAKGLL